MTSRAQEAIKTVGDRPRVGRLLSLWRTNLASKVTKGSHAPSSLKACDSEPPLDPCYKVKPYVSEDGGALSPGGFRDAYPPPEAWFVSISNV
jgi:hypothetical protein